MSALSPPRASGLHRPLCDFSTLARANPLREPWIVPQVGTLSELCQTYARPEVRRT